MSRWCLLLLAVLACALGLAACGGGDDDDVATVLRETFGEGKEVKSGRLDLAVRLDAKGLQSVNGPVGLQLSGPFESTKPADLPKFDFNLAIDAGGQQITAGAVSTGDKGFLRFGDQAYVASDEDFKRYRTLYAEQAKCNEEKGGKEGVSLRSLGVDPNSWLREAKKAGDDEKVGGAETTHISAGIDVPRFLEDVNRILGGTTAQQTDPCAKDAADAKPEQPAGRRLSAEDRKQIADAIKTATVDVWTGKDDRTLRRMNVALRFEVPQAQRERAGGLESGTLRFDLTIGDLNEKQDVKAPEGARPLDELLGQVGGQLPGLGGAGAGAGAGGGSAGAEAPQSGQSGQGGESGAAYQQCLGDAGTDVKKLQDCRELLNR